jgi:hypothetical protein
MNKMEDNEKENNIFIYKIEYNIIGNDASTSKIK